MSKRAAQIAEHLPYLRRYARALSGDQLSGDSYVAACLESIIANPAMLESTKDSRIALYRAFSRIWETITVPNQPGTPAPGWESATRSRLAAVSPKAREAFLLRSVEGFSASEVCEILDCPRAEVEDLLDSASQSILNEVATDILIIEDEPMIAMDLEAIVNSIGHRVTGIASSESEAVALAARHKPGLVLADIRLADGSSGIDAVNRILRNTEVPVIFITAFPERLLTGQRPEPTFMVAKPFLSETIKAVVSQALFFKTRAKAAVA